MVVITKVIVLVIAKGSGNFSVSANASDCVNGSGC